VARLGVSEPPRLNPQIRPSEKEDIQPSDGSNSNGLWIVTVFNNEQNTFDEVVDILIRATGCTAEEAEIETWEVDNLGKSVVHQSSQDECEKVAEIIREIGIRVEVSCE